MIISKPKTSWFMKGIYGLGICLLLCCVGSIVWPYPFLYNGTESAKKASCISNMKQVLRCVQIYASDNNEAVPPHFTFEGDLAAVQFRAALKPYLKTDNELIYRCPSDKSGFITSNNPTEPPKLIPGLMSHTHCLSLKSVVQNFDQGNRLLNLTLVPEQAITPYMRDPIWEEGGLAKSLHGEGIVIGYLDSHVKYKKPVDINKDL